MVKLMKYAARDGWLFSVLTQDVDRPVIPEKRLSDFLLTEIPAETPIFRVGNPFFGDTIIGRLGHIIFGNSSLPWGMMVAWRGWKKLHQSKPDLIFVNSPPFTNVTVGMILSRLFNVPFILDMKDDWVSSPDFLKKGRLRRAIESFVEKKVFYQASAVITVTRFSYEAYLQKYSPLGLANKIFFIPNGEDLEEYSLLKTRERKPEYKKFRLLSAAAGYRPSYRELTPFLQAVELFLDRCPDARNQIEIEFVGEEPNDLYKSWVEKLLPKSAVHYSGVLDRQSLIDCMWRGDLFFLVQPKENFTAISGTLYEYWATGKAPVLLFAETGASSSLVVDNQLGEHFQFNQIEEASSYIERLYQAFCDHRPVWIERSGVEEYDRKKMVQKMLLIWSNVMKNLGRH